MKGKNKMSNQPVVQTRDRNLSASVFSREVDLKGDGKLVPMYSIAVQRSYKRKGEDQFQRETINLNLDDCLRFAELLRTIYLKTLSYAAAHKQKAEEYPAQTVDADGFDDTPF